MWKISAYMLTSWTCLTFHGQWAMTIHVWFKSVKVWWIGFLSSREIGFARHIWFFEVAFFFLCQCLKMSLIFWLSRFSGIECDEQLCKCRPSLYVFVLYILTLLAFISWNISVRWAVFTVQSNPLNIITTVGLSKHNDSRRSWHWKELLYDPTAQLDIQWIDPISAPVNFPHWYLRYWTSQAGEFVTIKHKMRLSSKYTVTAGKTWMIMVELHLRYNA